MGVLKHLRTEGAAPQGVAPFPLEQLATRRVGGGIVNRGNSAMGRNVTLGIGTLIIILIIVALVF